MCVCFVGSQDVVVLIRSCCYRLLYYFFFGGGGCVFITFGKSMDVFFNADKRNDRYGRYFGRNVLKQSGWTCSNSQAGQDTIF